MGEHGGRQAAVPGAAVLLVAPDPAMRRALEGALVEGGLPVDAARDERDAADRHAERPPGALVVGCAGASTRPEAAARALARLRFHWHDAGRAPGLLLVGSPEAYGSAGILLLRSAAAHLGEPFAAGDVVRAVRDLLALEEPAAANVHPLSGARVDLRTGLVDRGGFVDRLTEKERALLAYLVAHPGQTLPRREILKDVWRYGPRVETNTLAEHLKTLRRKVEADPRRPVNLVTVHRRGVRFEPLREGAQ